MSIKWGSILPPRLVILFRFYLNFRIKHLFNIILFLR